MRRLFTILIVMISTVIYAKYDYPYRDKYVATILGTAKIMAKGVPENVPTKEFVIKNYKNEKDIDNMWFERGFKYSLSKQKGPAPLIFVLSGTGSAYDSEKTKNFQKIFYAAGYHVITVTSVFHPNFLINISSTKMPGILGYDGMDLYNIMKQMLNDVKRKEKIEITKIDLTGYSLGATHSAILSYIDSKYKQINFNRVYMINPSIDLYYSSKVLDSMLFKNIESKRDISKLIDKVLGMLKETVKDGNTEINEEIIYKMFSNTKMSQKDMEEIIGFAFNMTSVNFNYVVDQLTDSEVYGKKEVGKFTKMYPYYETLDFAGFQDYLNKLAYPYYKKKLGNSLTFNRLMEYGNLKVISDYLKNNKNIAVVTNEDDFILSQKDKEFIKNNFKGRYLIYPYGGHCGNMFYQTNIDKMLEFLRRGKLNNEL